MRWQCTPKQARCEWIIIVVVTVLVLIALVHEARADIPPEARQHRRLLVRSAHYVFGLDAPVATLAAQVHQESRWRSNAVSPVGAQGLAQFMPATAQWMPSVDKSLGSPQPYSPAWSLRAMAAYDAWLLARTPAASPCDAWAFTLAAYNGGLGWVIRDKKLALAKGANKQLYFNQVERYNAGRSAANFKENRHYVRVILTRHEAVYANAGWGNGVCGAMWL